MNESPINFPIGGLNQTFAKTDQPPNTTDEAVNVTVRDDLGDRARGGTRDGIALQAGTMPGPDPVRQLAVVPYNVTGSTFSNGAGTEEWAQPTPLLQGAAAVDIDLDRNRYAIDGRAGVAKWNADRNLVWKFVLPVESQEHICRALVVDDDGSFYVAVSAGFPQSSAKIMKYRPSDTGVGAPALEWTIGGSDPTPGLELGGYVERLRLRDGVLFAACNFPDRGASEIRLYRGIETSVPELAYKREQVPYPTNGMDVRQVDGAILTCHEANSTRSYDPRSPDTQKIAVDWTPERLTSWDSRKWCLLDASDLDGDDTFNDAWDNGESVNLWYDKTGQNRNAYSYTSAGLTAPANCTPPTLNKGKKFAGQDTVVFSNPGASLGSAHSGLVSNPNAATAANFADSQRTLIPTYTDAKMCVFMVLRTTDTSATIRCPLGQIAPGPLNRAVLLNANTTGGSWFTAAAGVASFHQSTNSGPYAAYDTTNGFCVVAFTCHNDGTAATTDLNSVNGTDCTNETFTGTAITSLLATQLGRVATTVSGVTEIGAGIKPFDGEIAYMLVLRDYAGGSIISNAEFEKIEGYLHWRFGIAHKLPIGHTYKSAPPTDDPLPGGSTSAYASLTDPKQMLVKWDPNKGRTRWVVKDSATVGIGGIGYDCAWPKNGATNLCFSHGPKGTAVGGTAALQRTERSVVRGIQDNGDSATVTGASTLSWEGIWGTFGASLEPSYHYPKCCVSGIAANSLQDGSATPYFYVPYHVAAAYPSIGMYQYLGGGDAGTDTNTPPNVTVTFASGSRGYACAVERDIPEYEPGQLSSKYDRYVFVGTELQGASTNAVSNVLLVTESRANANPKTIYTAALAGTSLRRVTSGGALATPTTSPTLAGLNYVSAIPYRERLWIADGTSYFVLDPRVGDGVSKTWRSKTSGALPAGGKLMVEWSDCLCIAHGMEVFMTAVGNPFDCDISPVVTSGAEAVNFPVPGVVTCLIPHSKDLLFIGTQSGLHVLAGHPAQGGVLKRVADVDGIAFGEPWCKDPDGNVYMFTVTGSVSRITSRGASSISNDSIRTRMQAIDLSTNFVRMEWDNRRDGLYVVPVPQGTGSGTPYLYFWHRATQSWWKYEVPWWITSIRQVENEVWFGCEDGNIRKFSAAATNDNGTAITWSVYVGPYRARSGREQIILRRPKIVVATGSANTLVGLYTSGDSERPASPYATYTLSGTLTDTAPIEARGSNVWLRMSGTGRWGYEDGTVLAEPFGLRQMLPS